MKKWVVLLLALTLTLLCGCGKSESQVIEIVIPAGSMADFVYSDVEISPQKDKIKIYAWAGMADGEVVLEPVEVQTDREYHPTYVTNGMPETMDVEKGGWFKIGVSAQNPSDKDILVSVKVEDVEIRIP